MKSKKDSTGFTPMTDPGNALGKAYAMALRERAQLLRSSLLVSVKVRGDIAYDLDALARIVELHPEVFGQLSPVKKE